MSLNKHPCSDCGNSACLRHGCFSGASASADRAVVNGAGQAVSALRASVPSAVTYEHLDDRAQAIATIVADRCHGKRKIGAASQRYATIWQAARLGALEALTKVTT